MENLALATLQHLIDRRTEFVEYPATRAQARALVIFLDKQLRERGYTHADKRREFRLLLYSEVVKRTIDTTNDLSSFEAGTILGYVQEPNSYNISTEGAALLDAVQAIYKDRNLSNQNSGNVGDSDGDPDSTIGSPLQETYLR